MVKIMKILIFLCILLLTSTGFAQDDKSSLGQKAEFKSDGCSWFPDGNYTDCCVVHDQAYYAGGSWKKRLRADNKLFICVAKKKGWYQPLIAPVMWAGVRVFGVSFLPTSFRWGFGNKKAVKEPKSKPKRPVKRKNPK